MVNHYDTVYDYLRQFAQSPACDTPVTKWKSNWVRSRVLEPRQVVFDKQTNQFKLAKFPTNDENTLIGFYRATAMFKCLSNYWVSEHVAAQYGLIDDFDTVEGYNVIYDDGKSQCQPYYNVDWVDDFRLGSLIRSPKVRNHDQRIPEFDQMLQNFGVAICEHCNVPHFIGARDLNVEDDVIFVPDFTAFDDAIAYYSCVLHEIGHYLRHQSGTRRTQSKSALYQYALEEIIAETFSSVMLSRWNVNSDQLINQAVQYVNSWTTERAVVSRWNRMGRNRCGVFVDHLIDQVEQMADRFVQLSC